MKRSATARAARVLAAALLATAATAAPLAARAAAPLAAVQAPGWYRTMVGAYEVTVLSDGTHTFPVNDVMTGIAAPDVARALDRQALKPPVQGSINAFLINTGSRLVLIDTGAGSLYGACCGRLLANLRASGYRPEQVDLVLLTHLHKDHVGGVLADGKPAFPNAVVRAARTDADYWRDAGSKARAPDFLSTFFDAAKAALAPYDAAGRFVPFDAAGAAELAPGIRALPESGHTPGHTGYLVENGGQALLVWGDVVHVAAIQLDHPDAAVKYDSDRDDAVATRRALLERAASQRLLVGAAHVAFPGLGHLRRDGAGYTWIPANYEGDPADPH
ncbi:MBL fold metallo-hydrolase [uncultured Massilia sp.]|uniref:MBL fold metallo-hydrolase n=1 Tax=uncultured Massilia sp. TaxID=169973 RepID=UPI0025DF27E6|nr:MBL fold metallo-hydrolase [uncultured Massilia sp.]